MKKILICDSFQDLAILLKQTEFYIWNFYIEIFIPQGSPKNKLQSTAEIVSKCRSNYMFSCSSDTTLDIVECEKKISRKMAYPLQ